MYNHFFLNPKIYILHVFSYINLNTKMSNIVDKYGRCYDSLCILGIFTYRLTIIFHSCQERNVRQMPGLLWGVFFSRKIDERPWIKKKAWGVKLFINTRADGYVCFCANNWRCFSNNRNEKDGFDICSTPCIFYKYSVGAECVSNV